MNYLKAYLTESKSSYSYRIKTSEEVSDEMMDALEEHLKKYEVKSVNSPKRGILQSAPIDFPGERGINVTTIDFDSDQPASQFGLMTEIVRIWNIGENKVKVRAHNEPAMARELAEEKAKKDEEYKVKLESEDYSADDVEKVDHAEYYGEDFKTKFVDEMMKLRREQMPEGVGYEGEKA